MHRSSSSLLSLFASNSLKQGAFCDLSVKFYVIEENNGQTKMYHHYYFVEGAELCVDLLPYITKIKSLFLRTY